MLKNVLKQVFCFKIDKFNGSHTLSVNPSVSLGVIEAWNHLSGPSSSSQTTWLSSSATASCLSRAEQSWAELSRSAPACSTSEEALWFIFHWEGIWLLSSGSSLLSNARLACKQAAGSSPSSPQRAARRPGPAEWSCDTDPTPITPRQPALIDPSNTLTSIYILFETCQAYCVYTCLCVCVCVRQLWMCIM